MGEMCSNVLAEAEKPEVRSEKVMALEKVPRVCLRPAMWGGQEQRGSVGKTTLKCKSLHATMGDRALSDYRGASGKRWSVCTSAS